MNKRSYLIVTPCRNEADFARRTLDSVLAQSLPPKKWIIVDDGSTDPTPQILAEYAAKIPCIEIVTRQNRGKRRVGGGVIEAFLEGLAHADVANYDYICKLDLDLDLPETYFECLIARMESDPRLGNCSGKAYFEGENGQLVREAIGDDVSVGAAKFFRTETYLQIGGFVQEVMWDGIDCHRCRMLGWKVRSWDDPEIRFLHLRPMGTSQQSLFHGRMRHGRGQYFMGSAWYFMLASAVFRLPKHPVLIGSAAMVLGYLGAAMRLMPRYPDLQFRKFLRRHQRLCLLRGKARACEILEAEGAAIWNRAPLTQSDQQRAGVVTD